jgi:hypothetical protein
VLNGNHEDKQVNTDRFAENLSGFTQGRDAISGNVLTVKPFFTIKAASTLILEFEQ